MPETLVRDLTLHLHANLEGRGRVYYGDTVLGEVRYVLKHVEEQLSNTVRQTIHSEPANNRRVYGIFRSGLATKLRNFIGLRLTLVLQDGCRLSLTIVKYLDANSCLVQALGDLSPQS